MNPRTHDSLQNTLSFFGVDYHRPDYILIPNPVFAYASNSFRINIYAFYIGTVRTIPVETDIYTL